MENKVNAAFIYLLSLFMFSCADEKEMLDTKVGDGPSLEFLMTRFSGNVINNTQVYLFDGQGTAAAGQFKQKIPGVTYKADGVSMPVAAGTWDFILVSADRDISRDVILPVRGQRRSALKMWETRSSDGVLPSIPELRTACLAGQKIVANQENTPAGGVSLVRNAALVKVVIVDAGGLDINGAHTLKLTNVPTTLNWEGGLYPDKNNPAVSEAPMAGTFTVHGKPGAPGRQCSDELNFIIPAHKGSDYLSAEPADTTSSHLQLGVDLVLEGGEHFRKDVEVPRVPRVNATLLVNLTVGGKLDVSTEILGWVDMELDVDLSQTLLYTDKASVGLAYKDTLHVNTNAADFTVDKEPGVPWLTVTRLDSEKNAVEVTADVNTYVDNHPRTSYITVKANNVTKKITVTQRPDEGTIKVDLQKSQMLFGPLDQANAQSEKGFVTSIGGNWKFIESPKVTASVTEGPAGTTGIRLIRTSTVDESYFETFYGDAPAVFKNTTTLATDTVHVSNLFIGLTGEVIEMAQPTLHPDTAFTVDNIGVYGGKNHSLTMLKWPAWVHNPPESYYDPTTKKFTFVCDKEPNEEPRTGEIILGHTDRPDYTVTLPLVQDIIVRIPEFDYLVITHEYFYYPGYLDDFINVIDVKVGFTGNPTSVAVDGIAYNTSSVTQFQDKYVGWRISDIVSYNAKTLLRWEGDITGIGGSVVLYAPVLASAPYPGKYGVDPNSPGLLPRTLSLSVNSHWYSTVEPEFRGPVECKVEAYLGGIMNFVDYNFINKGGTLVYSSSGKFEVINNSIGPMNPFDHLCNIVYDRKKHTAKIEWTGRLWKD